jgi:hypothetical protein
MIEHLIERSGAQVFGLFGQGIQSFKMDFKLAQLRLVPLLNCDPPLNLMQDILQLRTTPRWQESDVLIRQSKKLVNKMKPITPKERLGGTSSVSNPEPRSTERAMIQCLLGRRR